MKLFLHILSLCLINASVQAFEFISTNEYTLAAEETAPSELWINCNSTGTVSGTTQQDLFIYSAAQLTLDGTYKGDIWGICPGDVWHDIMGTIQLTGSAHRNVRLVGLSVQIDAPVGGNLMVAANTASVSTNAMISGDIVMAGDRVVLEGVTQGNATLYASSTATLSGTIRGTLKINAPEIIIQPNTRVLGDLIYTSAKQLILNEEIVAGATRRSLNSTTPQTTFSSSRLIHQLTNFIAAILCGLAFLSLFPMTGSIAARIAQQAPGKCLLIGLIASFTMPLLALACLFTQIGQPLGLLIFAAWGALTYLSRAVVALTLGTLLFKWRKAPSKGTLPLLAAGMGLIYIGLVLPLINLSVLFLVVWIGMGALLTTLHKKRKMIIELPHELQQQLEKAKEKANHPNS